MIFPDIRRAGFRAQAAATLPLAALAAAPAHPAPGEPSWDAGFGVPGMNSLVTSLHVFDDGAGPLLYVGGGFDTVDGAPMRGITRWNGNAWQPVGGGIEIGNGTVFGLHTYDEGDGPRMFAGGDFFGAGDQPALHIARWDGVGWSAVGGGTSATVRPALGVFDDGVSGPELYIGGDFDFAGGLRVDRVARWNGQRWAGLGGGMSGPIVSVRAFAVYDDGRGPALYVAGKFSQAGLVAASNVARWDGLTWSPVGAGADDLIRALYVFDDGGGPQLYAGGDFTMAGGAPASRIARWDGQAWHAIGAGVNATVRQFAAFDDGRGPALYLVGNFTHAGGRYVGHVARLSDGEFEPLGLGVNGDTHGLTVFNDGSGPAIYIGGTFTEAGGAPAGRVARWRRACPGDLNCDGDVNFADIDPFVLALSDPSAYRAAFPRCGAARADVNGDGRADFDDIEPFVALLASR